MLDSVAGDDPQQRWDFTFCHVPRPIARKHHGSRDLALQHTMGTFSPDGFLAKQHSSIAPEMTKQNHM